MLYEIFVKALLQLYLFLHQTGEGSYLSWLPVFQIYGRRQVFSGPIVTLKVFEDNVLVRAFLEEKGNGRVLVVDGGGSKRCAILGGNPVQQAQNNGWAGIVVNGCIRDVDEINGCDIGVRALASHPMKANKKDRVISLSISSEDVSLASILCYAVVVHSKIILVAVSLLCGGLTLCHLHINDSLHAAGD
ncbi:hypothetical protein MRB53_014348 [Persea americana]|uniref:Uncharacterized protein n=1 Tax=Persea americana TaxID=3435 RepID=A0ACC2KAL4_PERAE|nr:hypothetical protein MRB53_014348 [Persea americana]